MSTFKGCHKCRHGSHLADDSGYYTCGKPSAEVVVPPGVYMGGWHNWPELYPPGVVEGCDSFDKRVKLPKRSFREQPLGKYHELTPDEVVAAINAIRLRDERKKLRASIKEIDATILKLHNCDKRGHLVHDVAGHPYDVRRCLICGKTDLI